MDEREVHCSDPLPAVGVLIPIVIRVEYLFRHASPKNVQAWSEISAEYATRDGGQGRYNWPGSTGDIRYHLCHQSPCPDGLE